MANPAEILQQLGFGQYEAQAYVTLLQNEPLNGYELARESGIPRANIYSVLQKLEERGAVVRTDHPQGVRYAPVDPSELASHLKNRYQNTLESARSALEELGKRRENEEILDIRGYNSVLEHANAEIDAAKEKLLVAVWPEEAKALANPVSQAEQRQVDITTLCLAGCQQECGNCRGKITRHRVEQEPETRWLVVVPDEAEVLAGEIQPDGETQALRTRQKMLVHLLEGYVKQHIALVDQERRTTRTVKNETQG